MLEVLGEAPVSAEPCQCSFHHAAARQYFEALRGVGSLDDLDGPLALADLAQRLPELVTCISTIGEDVPQPREVADDLSQHERRAIAILDVGGVDYGVNQITVSVCQDVTLEAFDLLACIPDLRRGRLHP